MTQIPLPKFPKQWTAASTLKCTSCGADYEPTRLLAPHAAAGLSSSYTNHGCKCGNSTFQGTFGYDSPSPVKYTEADLIQFAREHEVNVLEAAAKVCEKRAAARFDDHGTREPDTGATYYGGRYSEEYEARDEEDEECAKAIRALSEHQVGETHKERNGK